MTLITRENATKWVQRNENMNKYIYDLYIGAYTNAYILMMGT